MGWKATHKTTGEVFESEEAGCRQIVQAHVDAHGGDELWEMEATLVDPARMPGAMAQDRPWYKRPKE